MGLINGGVYQGLLTRNEKGQLHIKWKSFNPYLPERRIRSLHVDKKGNIWIGTRYSGLVQLYPDLNGEYATQIFNRSDGFNSDFIKAIDSDEDGNIWVGTHGSVVRVSINRVENFLWMTITDNGIGFDPSLPSERHGLHSMKGRVARWKGSISLESSPLTGTQVRIGLPMRINLFTVK